MELTATLKQQLDAIGPVRHIVSPNYEHTKFARQWKDAYPEATLYGCPGLPTKSPDKQCATTCFLQFHTLSSSSRLPQLIQRTMCRSCSQAGRPALLYTACLVFCKLAFTFQYRQQDCADRRGTIRLIITQSC